MNKKKLLISIIAAVLVLAIVVAAFCIFFGPGDFRRVKWGMSKEQVKARESAQLSIEEYNSLSYPLDNIEGIDVDATMFYKFDAETDRLTHVSIGLNSSGFDDKRVSRIISALDEKYGDAETSETEEIRYDYIWKDKRTQISIKQLESYTLIIYSDINRSTVEE